MLVVCCLVFAKIELATARIPFFSRDRTKYTPLVFFTAPKGILAECDEMEKVVSQVEKELVVRVERLDCVRDPAAEATLSLLTQHRPPYLYHRESCQTVFVPEARSNKKNEEASTSTPAIDKARVRAWAKGRFLPPAGFKLGQMVSKAPKVIAREDNALDQEEIMKDSTLTPMQLTGKNAMKARTAEKTKKASE